MKKILTVSILILAFSKSYFSQRQMNLNYRSPLEIPLVFAANFGELRTNHFHMGIDYKTRHVEGLKIVAVQDGYVSRIKVSSYGYGKAIYINHPEGITSVYAHCSKFIGQIDSLISIKQEELESYEVDIYLDSTEIKVTKGQNIALSGNTGGSTAPHLHFELRDTKTETALNPLIFGYDIIDSKQPILSHLKIYSLSKEGYIASAKSFKFNLRLNGNKYVPETASIRIPINYISNEGGIGFSFDVYDPYDLSSNKLGIHSSELSINNKIIFNTQIDSISFENTRYINSHTDYYEFSTNRRNYHKSFKTINNPLSIYKSSSNGASQLKVGDTLNIRYKSLDTKKNTSTCEFKVIVTESDNKDYALINFDNMSLVTSKSVYYNMDSSIIIHSENGTFYEPLNLSIKAKGDNQSFSFGNKTIPIQKPIDIKISISNIDSSELKSYYLSLNDRYLETISKNNSLLCKSKYLGDFKLKIDTIAPSIKPKNFNSNNVQGYNQLSWKVYDLSSGLSDYDLFIDGKWYLLEYEYKNNTVTFTIPKSLKGTRDLKIIAKDNCLNTETWSGNLLF